MKNNVEKLGPGQIIVREKEQGQQWICEVDKEEYDFLCKKGTFDEFGNLVLPMPLIAGIKRFSPEQILETAEKYLRDVSVPNLNIEIAERQDIQLGDLNKATNEQLEEYLSVFGGYRAYLESQLSIIEARKGVLDAGFEEGLNKAFYLLNQKYADNAGRKPNKEAMRGEAIAENPQLRKARQDVIEVGAIYVRVKGLRDAYLSAFTVVSRIVSLRASSRDQV